MRSHTLHHALLCSIAVLAQLGAARAGSTADFPDVPEPKLTAARETPSRGNFELTPSPVSTARPATAPLVLRPTSAALSVAANTPATYAAPSNDNPYADYAAPNAAPPPVYSPQAKDSVEQSIERRRARDAWMLSLEAVTHAPIDVGAQIGIETPQRLRLFAGYGWVPGSYMNLLTGIASSASGNKYAQAFLDNANYSGRTWRLQGGIRPFPGIGLYADVGYAHLNAVGSLELTATGVPVLGTVTGGYRAETTLHMWLVELGYQGELADRVVLALALGCMGTFNANTTITPLDSAPRSNLLNTAAADADAALKKYGYAPTLTLRLGFDLI